MRQNRQYLFDISCLDVFRVLTEVGAAVSKFFGVGAGVLKHGAGPELESEKCDSAHLCYVAISPAQWPPIDQLFGAAFQPFWSVTG